MFKFLLIGFFVMVSNQESISQSAQLQTLEVGIESFYAGNWDRALDSFDALIKENPQHVEAHFFRSMIPFWSYFFGGENKKEAKEFLFWSNKAINLTESHLKKNPSDSTAVLFLSGLYGYRALVAADQGEYSIAIKSGMTGYNYTKKILAMSDSNPDAKIGRGIYYYMTGSVPSQIRWMTSALGFDGTKELGYKELEDAAKSDSRISVDANMILAYLYLKENKPKEALASSTKLLKKYPNNSIFYFHKAKALDALNKTQDAIYAYNQVVKLNDLKLDYLLSFSIERVNELNSSFTETFGTK